MSIYAYIHIQRECSAKPFMRSILCHKGSSVPPRFSPTIFYCDAYSCFSEFVIFRNLLHFFRKCWDFFWVIYLLFFMYLIFG